MSEEKLPAYFHSIHANTLTVFKRREDAPPEIIYRAEVAAPKPWVGWTDKEILADDVLRYYFGLNGSAGPVSKSGRKIVDAIEAALKEKNT